MAGPTLPAPNYSGKSAFERHVDRGRAGSLSPSATNGLDPSFDYRRERSGLYGPGETQPWDGRVELITVDPAPVSASYTIKGAKEGQDGISIEPAGDEWEHDIAIEQDDDVVMLTFAQAAALRVVLEKLLP